MPFLIVGESEKGDWIGHFCPFLFARISPSEVDRHVFRDAAASVAFPELLQRSYLLKIRITALKILLKTRVTWQENNPGRLRTPGCRTTTERRGAERATHTLN